MPSTAGATMDVPLASAAFSFVITVNQSVQRNSIYNFQSQYTKSGAVFPDDEAPVLTFRADCSHCTSKPAHMPPYLPDTYKNVTNVTLGTNTTDDTHSMMTARRLRILHSLLFLCILQKLLI
jgi:hypothetical protein